MEIELILVERCNGAGTATEVLCTLEQQLDLLYRLPRCVTAAGLQSDDGVVLAMLGMIAATARRRIDEMSNRMLASRPLQSGPEPERSQEIRAGPLVAAKKTIRA